MGNISFNEVLREIEEEMAQAAKAEQDRQREEEEGERKKNNLFLEQKPRPSGSRSKDGFVANALRLSAINIAQSSADYRQDMTANLFEKWFVEQLIPNIPQNSVVVMDNAPYHSRQLHKIPSTATKKEDIISFMRNK
nr:unnamed protein product [Callosobruchus chinensis]